MKLIVESHIPYIGDSFSGFADTLFLAPEDITPAAVADADALIVRTRTRCDAALLEGSKVRFVATATIGTDHIDLEYCRRKGIEVVSAPGCNAPAVAQYVWASILRVCPDDWHSLTLGIVGLGHVGAIVADWARRLGVSVLACDPPRRDMQGGWNAEHPLQPGTEPFVALDEIAAQADIVTFHVPHTKNGPYATHHMADEAFFSSLKRAPLLINAARGPIVSTDAILKAATAKKVRGCVIDCWEGEPALNGELLRLADVATPHIAGYSIEGKKRATAAVVAATLRYFGHEADFKMDVPPVEPTALDVTPAAILAGYNPMADTASLKSSFTPARFEQLRNTYPLRHELGFAH